MAITAAPFALKNLGLDAEPLRQAVSSLVGNNTGGIVQPGDLLVTQTGTPSLGVSVGVGRAWMPGTNTSNVAGQTYSTQGQYFAINDAPFTVNLTAANATNPRIDVIYIGAVDTQYGGASNTIKIDKVTGTPAATPVAPAIPANSLVLAHVTVAANATSITNANISQKATNGLRRQVLQVYANTSIAGNGANMLTNLATQATQPYIQCGSNVVTTDASGNFSIDFPVGFPNGLLTIVATNGDHSVLGVISVAGTPFTYNVNTFFGHVDNYEGQGRQNLVIRINWIAVGW